MHHRVGAIRRWIFSVILSKMQRRQRVNRIQGSAGIRPSTMILIIFFSFFFFPRWKYTATRDDEDVIRENS